MTTLLELTVGDADLGTDLRAALDRVVVAFDAQLESDLACVGELTALIERYRGKMLRPTLTLLCGLATGRRSIGRDHETLGAVVEMIHMATLVHDDVLDEADTRRRGRTVNALHGNEAAVILGDFLISSAFHLCSTLGRPDLSERIGRVTTTLCAGELLQLTNRGNAALNESTYFDIIDRKTASLIGLACDLGARASGAAEAEIRAVRGFGADVGAAFQIQDDLLDLTGDERVVGKSVRKDQEKGKLTLPMIRHLKTETAQGREAEARAAFEAAGDPNRQAELISRLRTDGSIASAAATARELVERATGRLGTLPDSPARRLLAAMGEAAVARDY